MSNVSELAKAAMSKIDSMTTAELREKFIEHGYVPYSKPKNGYRRTKKKVLIVGDPERITRMHRLVYKAICDSGYEVIYKLPSEILSTGYEYNFVVLQELAKLNDMCESVPIRPHQYDSDVYEKEVLKSTKPYWRRGRYE